MPFEFKIGRYSVGQGHPCFIIAEAGVNHNGSIELAKKMVDAAKSAGADAVKFQTFNTEELAAPDSKKAAYQDANDPVAGETQYAMLKRLELKREYHAELLEYCNMVGILFLSTPFDLGSADFLETLGMSAFKIPSGEITNVQLIRHIAKKNRPIILSTGMANLAEVGRAIKVIYSAGNHQLAILQCTTSYPAPPESLNLRAIQTLSKKFKVPVGFSDHSEGIIAPAAAVALGACIIEKHFTLDRNMPGPDHRASLEPGELREMVDTIRKTELMLGTGVKTAQKAELGMIEPVRKGLFAAQDISKGGVLTAQNIVARRPAVGILSQDFDNVIGSIAKVNIKAGDSLTYGIVQKKRKRAHA